MREIELKLEIRPEDVPRLLGSPRLRALAAGRGQTRSLHHFLVAGFEPAVANVLEHAAGEQKRVLQHDAELAS